MDFDMTDEAKDQSGILNGYIFNNRIFKKRFDPMQSIFLTYGPGIKSFFVLLSVLLKTYLILAVIAIIQMAILEWYNNENKNQSFGQKLTFAGFPYSRPICERYPGKIRKIHIQCDGSDVIKKVFDFGFLPNTNDRSYAGQEYDVSGICLGKPFRND